MHHLVLCQWDSYWSKCIDCHWKSVEITWIMMFNDVLVQNPVCMLINDRAYCYLNIHLYFAGGWGACFGLCFRWERERYTESLHKSLFTLVHATHIINKSSCPLSEWGKLLVGKILQLVMYLMQNCTDHLNVIDILRHILNVLYNNMVYVLP